MPFCRNVALLLVSTFASVATAQVQAKASDQQQTPTITTTVPLVIVDVTVTDEHKNPVRNLKASDFTVLEDKAPQQLKAFEEHSAASQAAAAKLPPLRPGFFTNFSVTQPGSPLNIVLIDRLNTPIEDQAYVYVQFKKYIESAAGSASDAQIAVFGLSTQLYLLQGFTTDRRILKAVLDRRSRPDNSPLLDSGTESMADTLQAAPDVPSELIDFVKQFEGEQKSIQQQMRARYTMDALNQLARYLSGLPGRKNLIWFSGSFPVSILPDSDLPESYRVEADLQGEFRETTNLLSRARVSVYPIDARGLMVPPFNSAEYNSYTSHAPHMGPDMAMATQHTSFNEKEPAMPSSKPANLDDMSKFIQQTFSEHATMLQMADATGGKAYINTNGLAEAVGDAIDTGSNYYTLAYTPASTKWDGSFRKIQVSMAQKGLKLTYRRGYYADDPDSSSKHSWSAAETNAGSGALPPSSRQALNRAMIYGAPGPTQVLFYARVAPASSAAEDTVARGNNPVAAKMKPPYRQYMVDFFVQPETLQLAPASGGSMGGKVEFVVLVYDRDGQIVNAVDTAVKVKIPAAQWATVLSQGMQFTHHPLSVPVKGDYSLRLAVYNNDNGRVGALEIPVETVSKLPPADATQQSSLPAK
ncbi:MAG: VWA domain-containing protein [Acidobacteriaceae bacterium]|nr:VWA domain-containing protein [Acidobacteriaceae bacterium]